MRHLLVGDGGGRELEELNIAARLRLVAGAGQAKLFSQGMDHLPLVTGHCRQALPLAAFCRQEGCQLALYALHPVLVGPGMGEQQGAVGWGPVARE